MTAAEAQAIQNAAAYGPEWEPYLVERKEVFASDAAGNRIPGAPSTFNESWGIRKKVIETVPYNGPVPTTEIPLALPQLEESYVSNEPLLIFDSDELFPGGMVNDSGAKGGDAFEISQRAREARGESSEKRAGRQVGKKVGQAQKGFAKRKPQKRKPKKRKH